MYDKIPLEKSVKIKKDKISNEKGKFKTEMGCIDQSFNMRIIIMKMLTKERKVWISCIHRSREGNIRFDWEAMRDVLKV